MMILQLTRVVYTGVGYETDDFFLNAEYIVSFAPSSKERVLRNAFCSHTDMFTDITYYPDSMATVILSAESLAKELSGLKRHRHERP